jgi:tetratricopeptide (TPR) repeat protein
VSADIAARDLAKARARVDGWLAERDDPRMRLVSARLFMVAKETAEAERVLRDLVEKDPSQLEPYDLLGRLYMTQGQTDRALSEYQALAGRTPKPAAALTMIGLIHESKGDRAAARTHYEQALAADAKAGVAANNLAWIYADEQRLDDALRLAGVAVDAMKQRPEAEDTLGWIYYLKDLPGHAIPAFERALSRAPNNPIYHYHLGLAQMKAGNEAAGRKALRRALELKPDFNGAEDARKALAGAS